MSDLLPARTHAEAYAYMDLRPCECGMTEFDRSDWGVLAARDGRIAVEYAGPCPRCGLARVFQFLLPDRPAMPADTPYAFSFPRDGPSELLDAGEWCATAYGYAELAKRAVAGAVGLTLDAAVREDVVSVLSVAVAALDEVIRFLPYDADVVPDSAFYTEAGREVRDTNPLLFQRIRLETDRAEGLRRLAAFLDAHPD